MTRSPRVRALLPWLAGLTLPGGLTALFYLLRSHRAVMDGWVYGVMGPVEQALGRLWSLVPFSAAELLTAAFLIWCVVWAVRLVVLLLRQRDGRSALKRLLVLCSALLWLWTAVCWMWNAAYSASSFAQRAGLDDTPPSVEELAQAAALFARRAAQLAGQVERDSEGHFAVSREQCLEEGVAVYEELGELYPFLDIPAVRAKPLLCSRLQSILGFTGVYFPFTGEANVNVDAPACLFPATIAHEMAHQRMVAAEAEANFVGIAAAVTCRNVTFQYSGYLMGLIQLSNALYSVDPETWYEIRTLFTQELATDWNDNNAYWAALSSPVEDAAGQAYDSFLKGNGQELGIRSYGACVDLLVNWSLDHLN